MATTTINLEAVNSAKETFKTSLTKQLEPIDAKISQHKTAIAQLELEKKQVQALLNGLDKKPSAGRVWTAEAKAKLSIALKAAAARKKAAAATATPATYASPNAPAPVVDAKPRAANDNSTVTTPAAKKRTGTR